MKSFRISENLCVFRLFVEELKLHHPGYATVSVNDRERVKGVNIDC